MLTTCSKYIHSPCPNQLKVLKRGGGKRRCGGAVTDWRITVEQGQMPQDIRQQKGKVF